MNNNSKRKDDFAIGLTLLVTVVPALIFFMALIGAIVIQNLPSDETSDEEDDTSNIGMYSYEEKPNNTDIFIVAEVISNNVYLVKENELNEVYLMMSDENHNYIPSQTYSIRYLEASNLTKGVKVLSGIKAITLFEEESNFVIPDSVYRKIYNDPSLITYEVDNISISGLQIQLIDSNDYPNEFLNDFKIFKAHNKLASDYSLNRVYNYEEMKPIRDDDYYKDTIEGIGNDKTLNYKSFDWRYYYGYLDPGYYYIQLNSEDTEVLLYFIVKEDYEVFVHDFQAF